MFAIYGEEAKKSVLPYGGIIRVPINAIRACKERKSYKNWQPRGLPIFPERQETL